MTSSSEITQPLVSIVIPTFKRHRELARLLKSIRQSDYPQTSLEIIIIDNASDLILKAEPLLMQAAIITPSHNLFSNAARQLGFSRSHGEYIFLLDDDNELEPHCISALVTAFDQDPKLGMVGPIMLEGNSDTIWCAGANVTSYGTVPHIYKRKKLSDLSLPPLIYNVDFFPNACLVKRAAMEKAPLDAKTFPHNWAEIDFGFKISNAGYKIACVTDAIERHHIGYNGPLTRFNERNIYDQARSRITFRKLYLSKFSEWLKFWLVIFPSSTLFYCLRIAQFPHKRLKMFKLYLRGTYDGLKQPANSHTT